MNHQELSFPGSNTKKVAPALPPTSALAESLSCPQPLGHKADDFLGWRPAGGKLASQLAAQECRQAAEGRAEKWQQLTWNGSQLFKAHTPRLLASYF